MSVVVFNAWDYGPFVCCELTQSLSPCKTLSHHLPHSVADTLIKLTKAGKCTAAISPVTVRGERTKRGKKAAEERRMQRQIHQKQRLLCNSNVGNAVEEEVRIGCVKQ